MMSTHISYITLLLTLLSANSGAERTPIISYITQAQIKDIGETVEFECSVQNAEEYLVIWIKMNSEPLFLSTGSALVTKNSRFALRYDSDASTYKLQIKDIQETDAGVYQCQIILPAHRVIAYVELSVRRTLVVADNSTPSIVALEGAEVRMECYASGYPKPTVTWSRKNNAMLPINEPTYVGNVFQIDAVQKEDRGTYYCEADNGVGKGDRRQIYLVVEFAPVIYVPRPSRGQALQHDMDLQCHIIAHPPPAVAWVKDGIQLSNGHHFNISTVSTDDGYTDSTLLVTKIENVHYGAYICKAVNKQGQAEAKANLFQTTIPVCPPACSLSL